MQHNNLEATGKQACVFCSANTKNVSIANAEVGPVTSHPVPKLLIR